MRGDLQVGILGVGSWGKNLLRNTVSQRGMELTAVCDVQAAARRFAADTYARAAVYDEPARFFDHPGLNAVIVATPPDAHFEHATTALELGLHVLVEKPLCRSAGDACTLIELGERKRRVLMVGHTFLYSNLVHEVKRRIDGGELGRVFYIHGQRLNLGQIRKDADVIWNFAPHDISIAAYLLDSWPTAVNARGAFFLQPEEPIADVAFFQMEFPGGVLVSGHVSWLDPQKSRKMVIVGSEKMLMYDDMDSNRHIQVFDKSVAVEFRSPSRDFCDFRTRVRAGDLVIPHIQLEEPLHVEIAHFGECVRSGRTPRTDGRHGLQTICVLEALSKSLMAQGERVLVDYAHAEPVVRARAGVEKLAKRALQPDALLLGST